MFWWAKLKNWLFVVPLEKDDDYIERKDIFLPTFIDEEGYIRDKVFVECRLRGPAVLVIAGDITTVECGFDGTFEATFWDIGDQKRLVGGIGVDGCIFRKCHFANVAFAGTTNTIERLRDKIEEG